MEEWYISTEMRRDYLKEVFEKQTDIALENLKRYQARFGDLIDVMMVCGTDMGTQLAPMLTPEKFNDLYMPYYKKMNGWIHEHRFRL